MSAQLLIQAISLGLSGRLEDLSFEWTAGSTVAILGPSGSGKTTLLRLLAGFEAPQSGTLFIDGMPVATAGRVLVPPEARALTFAFQDPALMPHLDVIANVHLGASRADAQRLQAARQALADVGLAGFERRRVWQLSGGEAQRVQLARTLAAGARMQLLDEPFASVDRMCRADLLARIGGRLRHGAGNGLTVIVTHDPADAMELSDRTLVLRAGHIVANGTFARIAAGDCGDWPARFLAAGLAGRELA